MKKYIAFLTVMLLFFAMVSCSNEPINIDKNFVDGTKSYNVGDQIEIITDQIGSVTVTYTDVDNKATSVNYTSNQTIDLERGSYVVAYNIYGNETENVEIKVNETVFDSLFPGFGTAERPYELSSAEDFKKLNDGKDEILEGKGLNFIITDDIDLRTLKSADNYAVYAFGGTLDGNGHKIIGSNSLSFIFEYYFEDTVFKNLTIEFDSDSITRLFKSPLVRVTKSIAKGNEYTSDGDNLGGPSELFLTEKKELSLTIDNVDYKAPDNHYYTIGDNNFSFYAEGNVSSLYIYLNGEPKISYTTCLFYDENVQKSIKYNISISGCDVSGNFIGGFGSSGAAVFLGGQLYGASADIKDCSFTGNLVGFNVGLLVANRSADNYNKITASNVLNNGEIKASSGNSSLSYGNNNKNEIQGVDGNAVISLDSSLSLTMPSENSEFDFSSLDVSGKYQLKLFMPSVYWFKKNSTTYFAQTNSNTLTVDVNSESKVYKAKVISDTDAKRSGISELSGINWNEVKTVSAEGYKYAFINVENTVYLVVCYGTENIDYSYSKDKSSDVTSYSYLENAILISYDADESIKALSKKV